MLTQIAHVMVVTLPPKMVSEMIRPLQLLAGKIQLSSGRFDGVCERDKN